MLRGVKRKRTVGTGVGDCRVDPGLPGVEFGAVPGSELGKGGA